MNKYNLILLIILLSTGSCKNSGFNDQAEYLRYLADTDNGLVTSHHINGFKLTMKYLPPELLAINESDDFEKQPFLQNLEKFNNTYTFVLSFQNDKEEVDISNYNVFNLQDYQQRMTYLNFDVREHFYIKTSNGKKVHPLLTTFENVYEVGNKKTIYLVFAQDEIFLSDSQKINIVFEDHIADTGINNFVFNKSALEEIPDLEFLN